MKRLSLWKYVLTAPAVLVALIVVRAYLGEAGYASPFKDVAGYVGGGALILSILLALSTQFRSWGREPIVPAKFVGGELISEAIYDQRVYNAELWALFIFMAGLSLGLSSMGLSEQEAMGPSTLLLAVTGCVAFFYSKLGICRWEGLKIGFTFLFLALAAVSQTIFFAARYGHLLRGH